MTGEPEAKQLKRGSQCLNCGLVIDTAYCPDCGQHNASHNHGLWQFIQEFLEEFIRFDSKILRTLIPLVTKPGFLTQEWTAGKRVRYISPLKLYVTLSAIFFLAVSFRTQLYGSNKSDFNIDFNRPAVNISAGDSNEAPLVSSKDSSLDQLFKRKIGRPDKEHINAVKDKFMSQLPTTNFVLMPIVAGIFWILYVRRKRYYVEHLVFTLHFYSFAFLVFAFASLIPVRAFGLLGLLWIMVYLPIALVKNYGQGYLKTIVKLVIFGMIYSIVLVAALFGTLVTTAWLLPDQPAAISQNAPAK